MRETGIPGVAKAVEEFAALGAARSRDARGYLLVRWPASSATATNVWNAFVALVSYSGVDELHPAQRDAWWVLTYETEVQSGGHAGFLDRHSGADAERAIDALRALGAAAHAELLQAAVARAADAGSGREQRQDLGDLDRAFAAVSPGLVEVLERLLRDHARDFVVTA